MELTFLYILFSLSMHNSIPNIVTEYHEVQTKSQELTFIDKYKNSRQVAIRGYVISLQIKHAKDKLMPWQKLKVFNAYTNELEDLIQNHSENVHLRYLRLVIQEKAPSLLNYNSDIEGDKFFLAEFLAKKDSTDYLDTYIIKNTSL